MKTTLIAIISMGLISPMAFADGATEGYRSKAYSKFSAIKDQIDTNTANIESLTTQVQNLPTGGGTGTTPSNDAQVQSNTSAITNLTGQVQTNTGNISGNAAQIQGNTGNINSVSAEAQANTALNAAQATQIQANSASNAAQATQIQANSASNAAQDTQIQANTAAVNAATTTTQTLQGNVDALTTQVGTMQSDVNVQGTQVQSNTDGIASNTARISALESGSGTGGGTTLPPPEPAPTIDFTLYIPNATTKDFQLYANAACTTVTHDITRVDNANDSDITITETLTNGVQNCTVYNHTYKLTVDSFSVASYNDSLVNQTIVYEAPGVLLNSSMEVGKTFGFAQAGASNPMAATMQKNTILAIEPSVTVLAGTFANCLKIQSTITSSFIIPNTEQVSWHCEGIGEVKRMYMDKSANEMRTMVLRTFN